MTIPSTHPQISQVGARFVDTESNMFEVENKTSKRRNKIDIEHTHSKGVEVPISDSNLSSHDSDIAGSSPARPCILDMMLQLDRPTFIHARRRPATRIYLEKSYNA